MDKQKKQMVMVGALLLVLVAVGAFQFMGPKPAAPKTDIASGATDGTAPSSTGTDGEVVTGDGTEVAMNAGNAEDAAAQQLTQNQLPTRDPFMPTSAAEKAAQENAEQGLKTAAPVSQNHAAPNPGGMAGAPRQGNSGGGYSQVYNPFPGQTPSGLGMLPEAGGSGQAGGATAPNLEPAKRSGYKVVGTIVGKQKMVVLEDPDGNQVLVPEGKKTPDGKARVVGVQKGKAQVSQEGQVKMLGLEEE